jgi:tetratricopeptide (TPR) repeat protein
MEELMKVGWEPLKKSMMVAGCLLLAIQIGIAQNKTAASPAGDERAMVAEKARALESRGRPDMAAQLWQQILLSEPNNADALAGLARDYKLMGSSDKASQTLDRLRRVNPNDPNISRIESLSSSQAQSEDLRRAGDLARQGKADDAMAIYRRLYGDHPPDDNVGAAYYQTLYATATGKAAGIAGMRSLAARHPGDETFEVPLGTMLTYDPRTRTEGIRILMAHQNSPDAQSALRQALLWDSANPSSAALLRQYLKAHPQDQEVATNLHTDEQKLARMNSGIARNAAERAAFAALNAHRLQDAEAKFDALERKEPKNGRVAAGMGFLRMQQQNFGGAISYLTQAEQDGYKTKSIENALESSRFWLTMSDASDALNANKLDVAEAKYKAALAMNAKSPVALVGLAGLLMKQQRYAQAAGVYEQLVAVQPASLDGWRGLFLAYANGKQNERALLVQSRFPAPVKSQLARDPEYLRTLATIYLAQNRSADAERVLAVALTLPFPDNGTSLKTDTKLQYAGILMDAKRYSQAAALYEQIVSESAENPTANLSAWMGLVSAYHLMGRDAQALAEAQKMPSATYQTALGDTGFLSQMAAIYQQTGDYENAQGMLESAIRIETAAGRQPGIALQLQLAAIYLVRGNTAQAYAIYQRAIATNPDRPEAWKGLIGCLLAAKQNADALQELSAIPAPVRKQLEGDVEFEQSEASIYSGAGDTVHAMAALKSVQAYYARLKTPPPANIDIQTAWLYYNTGNDRELYGILMRIGGRGDLSLAQRETVQDIWADWSVRRAAQAMDNGSIGRAVDILDAAAQAFPDNIAVRKAVAGGYASVGRAKEALKLYKTIPMQDASVGDYQGAINAALAAGDRTQAEDWLRHALELYARDPEILTLAARFEQARGDNQRAADYWRAAIAAMPASSPADKLAHELVYPEQDTRAHRAVTAGDLQHLLDPDSEPFPRTTKLPPLPAYGPDPYGAKAPAAVPDPSSSSQQPNPQLVQQRYVIAGESTSNSQQHGAVLVRDAVYHPSRGSRFAQAAVFTTTRRSVDAVPFALLHQASFAQPQAAQPAAAPIAATAPHTMQTDAYKGLIFSLMAGNRNAEALRELANIPPDARRLLESDIEFVQGIASLYIAVSDFARATEYLKRVDSYYLAHGAQAPAGLEIQRAWMLYNFNDDADLYPVIMRLDPRGDLTADQRSQLNGLWASWAVRRAQAAIAAGDMRRGVQILQAASQDYPDNMGVRRAVAGAYLQVGWATDAVALFKTIPMDNATPADYQGAISAALAAPDKQQAEQWLRQALLRYPGDPKILALAGNYEHVRGDDKRAAQYWRAALAAMPAGSTLQSLDSKMTALSGTYQSPLPGDTKRLLDPRADTRPLAVQAPLPSYHSADSSTAQGQATSGVQSPAAPAQPPVLNNAAPVANPPITLPVFINKSDATTPPSVVHPVPNVESSASAAATPAQPPVYRMAQYTPSAQDAATGAYSAPQQQTAAPAKPTAAPSQPATRHTTRRRKTTAHAHKQTCQPCQPTPPPPALESASSPPLSSAPAVSEAAPAAPPVQTPVLQAQQDQTQPAASQTGLTDEHLEQRNLPPLRGPWVRLQRQQNQISPREEAEMQLHAIESGYSGWLAGTGLLNYRSGVLGYDHLTALEAPFEASVPMGYHARFTVVARPVFLDSGQADGTATVSVLESGVSGSGLTNIPEPIGTQTNTNSNPPAQQNATGLGGEVQLAFPNFAIAGGYTPYGFLVTTVTGRMMLKPGNGPITINFVRDAQKDSQLSYAGLRDPAGNALGHEGQIWGGVVYNQGNIQFARGDAQSGYYFSAGGQYLTGYNVRNNTRIDGDGGAWWRAWAQPEYGNLSVGINFFAMHYANNDNAFTHGMGGYFSPQMYFLANVPFTYTGHYQTNWHYNVVGAFGLQAFQENRTPLWPLAVDKALETSLSSPMLPDVTSVGPNYDLRGQVSYQIGPHWFAGGFFGANNTRNYNSASVGFSVHYMFRAQPSAVAAPTGLFPTDGLRPFTVP